MSLIAESAAQKARLAGFKASLRVRGRLAVVTSSDEGDNEQQITLMVDDMPVIADPDGRAAQAETPVYSTVACLAGSLDNPRAVTRFTEDATGKVYNVIRFVETAGDRISWKWDCEAQRDEF